MENINKYDDIYFCWTPVIGLRQEVDFIFALDKNNNKNNNPH